ncbi:MULTISPECIES: MAPEG family protein [unclassified Anabaena]|uniref:MAPEG family protein n=1 Tax=unclassified Anabaena TaxID=2619674 RepID=UPI00083088D2|nr:MULTISPECIES: MAPEG family protein [unclassified Anabaena]
MDSWKAYGLTVIALFLKMFATVLIQAYGRFKSNSFSNPEDLAIVSNILGRKDAASSDDELVRRAQNVLRNDGENIPIFLFLAMTYVQLNCWQTGVLIYFPLFVASRILHTVAYIRAIQPLRNIVYQVGILVMFALCSHIGGKIWVS